MTKVSHNDGAARDDSQLAPDSGMVGQLSQALFALQRGERHHSVRTLRVIAEVA
ncbi:hypothetical protein FHX10_001466 [Rhizobium sp. BK591]|uniref:hypothetical protein n=1 Tax=Rhizobium anhuiense TaxID=1184720 RepID=UPI0015CF4519|nr:hypothetical protein [Rhizobium anhuiense]MBB3741973.1 hypothetical protein [Rhizobium sp. BK591]